MALACFAGLTRHVTLAFVQAFPPPEAAQQATCEHLHTFLLQVHYPRPAAEVARKAAALHALLQTPQLHAAPGAARAKARFLQALVASEQGLRDEAGHMLELPHIDADVEGFMSELVNEVKCGGRCGCLRHEPPSRGAHSEGEEETPALRAGPFLSLSILPR